MTADTAVLAARPFVSHSARCRMSGAHACLCGYDERVQELAQAFRWYAIDALLGRHTHTVNVSLSERQEHRQ